MNLAEGCTVEEETVGPMANIPMTIEVAQNFFKEYGDDTQGLYEEIYKNVRRKDGAELANDNYLDALQLTALMIRKTRSSLRMFTGCTAEAFIGHLNVYFAEMIARLSSAGSTAQMIVLNSEKRSGFLDSLVSKYPNTLNVVYASAVHEETISHFIVADDMVRLEKPHPRLKPDTPASVIQARVLFNNRGAASIYEAEFDSMFKKLAAPKPRALGALVPA